MRSDTEICKVFCSYKDNDTLLLSSKSRKRSPVEVSVHFPSSCISTVEAGNCGVCLCLALYKVEFVEFDVGNVCTISLESSSHFHLSTL
jgi:hypothetical protein